MTAIENRGWIRWNGGECPIKQTANVRVRVRLPDGRLEDRKGWDTAGWFGSLGWWSGERGVQIVAYCKETRT